MVNFLRRGLRLALELAAECQSTALGAGGTLFTLQWINPEIIKVGYTRVRNIAFTQSLLQLQPRAFNAYGKLCSTMIQFKDFYLGTKKES